MSESTPTFMVEAIHEHGHRRVRKVYCGMGPDCARKHRVDEDGQRWHPPQRAAWQTGSDVRRLDTGEIVAEDVWHITHCRIPGAMFWQDLQEAAADERRAGSRLFVSGRQLTVILPDLTPWIIDARANNCGKPADFEHRCWIPHGEPPAITVDKAGLTCEAGAGSIDSGTWHGFLRNGALVR